DFLSVNESLESFCCCAICGPVFCRYGGSACGNTKYHISTESTVMFRHTKLKPYCHAVALSLLLGLGGKACAEIHDHPQTNVVLGHRATANGLNAVAIGAGATASEEQSIAIGAEFMRFGGGAAPILDRRNAAP